MDCRARYQVHEFQRQHDAVFAIAFQSLYRSAHAAQWRDHQRWRAAVSGNETGRADAWPYAARAGLQLRVQRQMAFVRRSEEHTSELQSLMRISYAVFCLKKT